MPPHFSPRFPPHFRPTLPHNSATHPPQAYDPEGKGYIDAASLKGVFSRLGMEPLSDEDISVLSSAAGRDRDGKIGLEEFRAMLDKTYERAPTTAELGRPQEDY